jgi:hypothetical protein
MLTLQTLRDWADVSASNRKIGLLVRLAALTVVDLWKEIAPAFRRHVEKTPQRVDEIASAVVLLGSGKRKAHL